LDGMNGFLKWTAGIAGAVLGAIFTPPFVAALTGLLFLFFMDWLSGSVAAVKNEKPIEPEVAYSGKSGAGGWRRKTQIVLLVLSVAVLQELAEYLGNTDLSNLPTATVLCFAFATVELTSIARNAALSGAAEAILEPIFRLSGKETKQ
jgi:hypothetical protein